MVIIILLLLFMLFSPVEFFIVGGCIGPKTVLEKFLSPKHRTELRRLVHNNFDGSNVKEVLKEVNQYVYEHITDDQWLSIVPLLQDYQTQHHDCSIYAQLLPREIYKQLLQSVFRASEMGASKYDVKRLVEDYVERLAKAGILPDVNSVEETELPLVSLPPDLISSSGYRNSQTSYSKNRFSSRPNPTSAPSIHPTLIGYPQTNFEGPPKYPDDMIIGPPKFPIARPSTFDLDQYVTPPKPRSQTRRIPPRPQMRRGYRGDCDYGDCP